VRFALAEKSLEVRVVDADPARPPEDLIDLNPYQAVPTLVDRDLVVYEARIVCEYLDERYPHPPLLPTDPVGRAQTRVAVHRIEQDWYGLLPGLDGADRRERDRARRLLRDSVIAAEPLSAPLVPLDQFSLLDAAVAPVLWRLPHWGIELPDDAVHLRRYVVRVFARPSFRTALSEREWGMRS
jgi:RNA polymerase-associated protein